MGAVGGVAAVAGGALVGGGRVIAMRAIVSPHRPDRQQYQQEKDEEERETAVHKKVSCVIRHAS